MTAVDPSPRALPEIGLGRAAMLVKTGWHVYYAHAWRLVLDARRRGYDKGPVLLTLRDGLHDQITANLKPGETLMSRTPEEQIRWIEAGRSSARGGGPVSRLALDQATAALLNGLPRCPACGGLTGWEDKA